MRFRPGTYARLDVAPRPSGTLWYRVVRNAASGKELAKRIRAAMAYAGVTERELADCIGVSRATISRTVASSRIPRRMELREIADVCGVPLGFFTADWHHLDEPEDATDDLAELQRVVAELLERQAERRGVVALRRRQA